MVLRTLVVHQHPSLNHEELNERDKRPFGKGDKHLNPSEAHPFLEGVREAGQDPEQDLKDPFIMLQHVVTAH